MKVWNQRTGTWNEERLGVVVVDELLVTRLLKEPMRGVEYARDIEAVMYQLPGVVDDLKADPTTRRAVMYRLPNEPQGDYPCWCLAQFMLRLECLVAFFYWRSGAKHERREDVSFMRWATAQVAVALDVPPQWRVVIYAFVASDHEVLKSDLLPERAERFVRIRR